MTCCWVSANFGLVVADALSVDGLRGRRGNTFTSRTRGKGHDQRNADAQQDESLHR
ncbi:hypothetical protein GCM10009844_38920 [Nocardioides koreensis]|uniref:Uncharacterized protein n=1 Tax=Nocardioides koreensis TaxID=433651 RepID=A0ABN3A4Q5_9ACTN